MRGRQSLRQQLDGVVRVVDQAEDRALAGMAGAVRRARTGGEVAAVVATAAILQGRMHRVRESAQRHLLLMAVPQLGPSL